MTNEYGNEFRLKFNSKNWIYDKDKYMSKVQFCYIFIE